MSVKKLEQHFFVQPDELCDCRDLVSFQKSQLHRSSKLRISAMVINRFGERDQSGRWCCAVNGL
ncbi:hypothetical protein KTD09_29495 [Burkholderia multivorans]|uniref:hypothetical protein n=1 Tax=Burkholderia multivorans TaxID=87883 RepID=UPI001C239D41|nr:hypothetical protein [Burkholderia multivorans]MBU9318971.1 hypothetical protein [Burkholderia multivorans]